MDEQRKNGLPPPKLTASRGRTAVIEALRAGETIDKIYLQKGDTDKTLGHIASSPGRGRGRGGGGQAQAGRP